MEKRQYPSEPLEHIKHRILVQCNKLELNLQIEPIFASMAVYDAKERKKISENFYFDMNPEPIRKMLEVEKGQLNLVEFVQNLVTLGIGLCIGH